MTVLDASALLTYLQGEHGHEVVEEVLEHGAACGAANWSEVAQKVRAHGRNWALARSLLQSDGVRVEAVTEADAEWAASRWLPGEGLSLADRLCLALGERLDAAVLTADTAWGEVGRIRQVRPTR
ncbi:MAG TPA: PIN domain-containing protein [Acidimicrobiales bacterium]|nr:PIN domain-containing protein [Acidimicrobiales bacterium]